MTGAGARGALQLAVLAVLGLLAGVWVFVAPWVVGFPGGAGGWATATWSNVWVGAIVAAVSALGLVAASALAVSSALGAHGAVEAGEPASTGQR